MKHILLIDDDPAILLLFEQFLEDSGFSVTTASNGREGLRILQAQTPHLIITDIMMPEMDGLEILQEIRKTHSDIPIIAISGGMRNGTINFLPLAKRFGACKGFEKPIALDKLKEAVDELLSTSASK